MRANSRTNLAESICQEILVRITSGQYSVGEKIPSIRALMNDFSVSSQTVQRALRQLQDARAVTAIQGSGVYVNAQPSPTRLRLAMIFPEQSISRSHLDLENWGMSSELQRGLLSGGVQYGARLEFIHTNEEASPEEWRALTAELRDYNGAIFIGQQLSGLQKMLSNCLPVFQYNNELPLMGEVQLVDYDREGAMRSLLRQAAQAGCQTASCLSYLEGLNAIQDGCFLRRAELMLRLCPEYGLRPLQQQARNLSPQTRAELDGIVAAEQADFLFCNHAYLVRDVFELCRRQQKTILLGAIGSGATFQGLHPGMFYLRVPMFEAGLGIVRCLHRLATGEPLAEACDGLQQFAAELVVPSEGAYSRLA